MSLTVKIGEAKTRPSELLAKVEAGEEVVIARGNEPIAWLTRAPKPDDFAALFAEVKAVRAKRARTSSEELLAWHDEGRRFQMALVVDAWLAFAKIDAGPVSRRIDKWGNIGAGVRDPQSVTAMIKSRYAAARFDPGKVSAHGLRSGYLAEAARAGVPLPEAMHQSRHRSVQQAAR